MTKSTRNSGKSWSPIEVKSMAGLASKNTPTRVIGLGGKLCIRYPPTYLFARECICHALTN